MTPFLQKKRVIALALLATAAAAFAATAHSATYSAVVCLVAAIGLSGRLKLTLSRSRRLILTLALGLAFAAKWKYAPFNNADVESFIFYPVAHAFGQFLLAMMAVGFFLADGTRRPTSILVYGTLVFICAGDVCTMGHPAETQYRILALVFMGFAAFYCATLKSSQADKAMNRMRTSPSEGGRTGKAIAGAAVLSITILLSWVGAGAMRQNETKLNSMFEAIVKARRSVSDIGFNNMPTEIGLSDSAYLESINHIRATDTRVMLRVFGPVPPGYLRTAAYDTYGDSRWTTSVGTRKFRPNLAVDQAPASGESANLFQIQPAKGGGTVELDIWPSPDLASNLFTTLETSAVRANTGELTVSEHGICSAVDMPSGVIYQVIIPTAALSNPPPPELLKRCLAVPAGMNQQVVELAGRLMADCKDTQAKIAAVEGYFHANYKYRLDLVVPQGEDPLTYFLLQRPGGHCEYFASGAAVLLRLGGVPTRYVTGFVSTAKNDYGGYWYASSQDAHAWVEAWDDQKGRWYTVEATPSDGVPSGQSTSAWARWWDQFTFRLQELRIAIHFDGMAGLGFWLYHRLIGLLVGMVTTVPGLIICFVLAALILRRMIRKSRRQKPRQADISQEIKTLQALLVRMDRRLVRHGLVRSPAETLRQFSRRIRAEGPQSLPLEQIAKWYTAYAEVRYRPEAGLSDAANLEATIPAFGS